MHQNSHILWWTFYTTKLCVMKYIEKQMVVMQLKYPFKKWWNLTSVNDNWYVIIAYNFFIYWANLRSATFVWSINVIDNEKKNISKYACMSMLRCPSTGLGRFWAMAYDSAHVMWMLRGPFLVQMEAIGQEPKCVSVVSCSPSPLRLPRDFDGRRRHAAKSSELRLSTREKEMCRPCNLHQPRVCRTIPVPPAGSAYDENGSLECAWDIEKLLESGKLQLTIFVQMTLQMMI